MKLTKYFVPLMCAALLSGCSADGLLGSRKKDAEEYSAIVFAMDTEMSLKAYGENGKAAIDEARREINRLDGLLRRGSEDSDIYKINENGAYSVSEDTAALTEFALDICRQTDGAFDISIAPVMDLWGFYTKEFHVPSEPELSAVLDAVDHNRIAVRGDTVEVSDGAKLDLGGIAKGYLSSRIMDIYKEHGVKSGIVSLGGNVQALGAKPDGSKWNIAIQDPADLSAYIGSVRLCDSAVVTSGGYQRFFEDDGKVYHHIIDPATGYPAHSGVISVTVISADGTLADGLSTALYVMGLDKGGEYWRSHDGFEAIFVTEDNSIYITQGLEGVFETRRRYEIIKR